MYRYHRYTNTLVHRTLLFRVDTCYTKHYYSCTCNTVARIYYHTGHCHFMYVSLLYRSCIQDTIISCLCTTDTQIHYFTGYCVFIYLYHRNIDTLHTIISCSYIPVTRIHQCTCVDCFCNPVTWITVHI